MQRRALLPQTCARGYLLTKTTQVVRRQTPLTLYMKNFMVAFVKLTATTSSDTTLSSSVAGWHHLQSAETEKTSLFS